MNVDMERPLLTDDTASRFDLPTEESRGLPNACRSSGFRPEAQRRKLFARTWMPPGLRRDATDNDDACSVTAAGMPLVTPRHRATSAAVVALSSSRHPARVRPFRPARTAPGSAVWTASFSIARTSTAATDTQGNSEFAPESDAAPHACLFDIGVKHGHRLLAPALAADGLHAVGPAWGSDDSHGHGTAMVGPVVAGNLTKPRESTSSVEVGHRIESVKLLPCDGAGETKSRHHGFSRHHVVRGASCRKATSDTSTATLPVHNKGRFEYTRLSVPYSR